ncbi:MAG TPA: dihydropteroate synthase [Steroidobacteraceae bacterium]|jgi:dihydropteroate synthase
MRWQCRDRSIDLTRPIVMGILNVTPDSFSDGGRYASLEAALARGLELVEEGATVIDIGGESTRPGSAGVSAAEEAARVVPLIEALSRQSGVAISVDTSKVEVMAAAVAAGACIVNDIKALKAAGARELAASLKVGVCLMHMQGEPRTMQVRPYYNDVVAEVLKFLSDERLNALRAGIASDAIVLDPGIGFGKRLEHNLALLKGLKEFASLPAPLLVGVSRKAFIGKILGREVDERLYGGLGLAALAVCDGARIIRTHDVRATRDCIAMVSAVLEG